MEWGSHHLYHLLYFYILNIACFTWVSHSLMIGIDRLSLPLIGIIDVNNLYSVTISHVKTLLYIFNYLFPHDWYFQLWLLIHKASFSSIWRTDMYWDRHSGKGEYSLIPWAFPTSKLPLVKNCSSFNSDILLRSSWQSREGHIKTNENTLLVRNSGHSYCMAV